MSVLVCLCLSPKTVTCTRFCDDNNVGRGRGTSDKLHSMRLPGAIHSQRFKCAEMNKSVFTDKKKRRTSHISNYINMPILMEQSSNANLWGNRATVLFLFSSVRACECMIIDLYYSTLLARSFNTHSLSGFVFKLAFYCFASSNFFPNFGNLPPEYRKHSHSTWMKLKMMNIHLTDSGRRTPFHSLYNTDNIIITMNMWPAHYPCFILTPRAVSK